MTELELLRAVRARLSDPVRWTQNESARTNGGEPCTADDLEAHCWCVSGAMMLESQGGGMVTFRASRCLDFQAKLRGFRNEVFLNDGTDHATVLAMIDAAMETGEVAL